MRQRRGKNLHRALEVCLRGEEAGGDREELLASYPKWAGELDVLLDIAGGARLLGIDLQVPQTAQMDSRVEFLEVARRLIPRSSKTRLAKLARLAVITVSLIAIMALLAWSIGEMSAQSRPGSVFYPLRRAGEWARTFLADSPAKALERERLEDQRRLEEVKSLIQDGQSRDSVSFSGEFIQSGDIWKVGGVTIAIPTNAQLVGIITPGYHITVEGLLQSDGVVLARRLKAREYQIEGSLVTLQPEEFEIDGVIVRLLPDTLLYGELSIGRRVLAMSWLTIDEELHARWVEVLE